jgi:uncharacterized protein (DUF1684 family)
MHKIFNLFFSLFIISTAFGQSTYNNEIEQWKIKRVNSLKSDNGWLNLAGLFWLEEGKNSFGSASNNQIIFPKGSIAHNAGNFILESQTVKLNAAKGVAIKINDQLATSDEIVFSKELDKPVAMSYGSLHWTIIKREDKIGIRLRDYNSPLAKTFTGAERFPTDSNWKFDAVLQEPITPSTIPITNVLGQIIQMKFLGKLVFKIKEQTISLDAVEEGQELFVIFGDLTNKKETYGAGRFLYAPKPDASGKIVVDFNKAFNPPCAFTPYATCPLPPKQNILPIAITAGEKTFMEH